jgi:phosphohistidine phosphatase
MAGQQPEDPVVLLVHHQVAVGPKEDSRQPLSLAGRAMADALAADAARRGVRPAAIWHSGKLRAKETAEAFWRACNPLATFSAVRGLLPADPPDWIRDRLLAEDAPVVVVGHMPHLARLLESMVDAASAFPPHGMVCARRVGDTWRELWRAGEPLLGGR